MAALTTVALSAGPAAAQDYPELRAAGAELQEHHFKVIGNWSNSPTWIFSQEPFWNEKLPELTGGKLTADISSMTELNLKGPETLRLIKLGMADVIDTIANYAAGDAPELDGVDLAGVAPDFDSALKAVSAYTPAIKDALQERLGLVPIAMGPSNAQIFWCNVPITGIEDLQGKKVRGYSATMADLIGALGATPVTMAYSEVPAALQRGVIDCAITGALTGNVSKLFEVTTHVYPLAVAWAPWIRAFSTKSWEALDPATQEWVTQASETIFMDMNTDVAREASDQGVWCSTSDERCTWGEEHDVTKANLTLVEVTEADREVLKKAVESTVLPAFAKACGPDCTARWNESIGKAMGLTAKAPE
jgi:TRAP-type C4-dicarboxylate transport system substrate-binding protein